MDDDVIPRIQQLLDTMDKVEQEKKMHRRLHRIFEIQSKFDFACRTGYVAFRLCEQSCQNQTRISGQVCRIFFSFHFLCLYYPLSVFYFPFSIFHFPFPISCFPFHISYFIFRILYFVFHISYFISHISYLISHISYFYLPWLSVF